MEFTSFLNSSLVVFFMVGFVARWIADREWYPVAISWLLLFVLEWVLLSDKYPPVEAFLRGTSIWAIMASASLIMGFYYRHRKDDLEEDS